MKKLILLCILTLSLLAQSAQPAPIEIKPSQAVELARIEANADSVAKLAQYERAVPIIVQQRDSATALAQNLQAQLQLLSADLAAAQKEVADLKAKVAKLEPAPKPSTETKVAAAEPKK